MEVERLPENYKSDLLPEEKFPPKIDKSIKRIVEKEGFIKYNIYKRSISTNGGNYLGDLYEIDVNGKTLAQDKELNIFVKNIIDNEESVKICSMSDVFKTELFVYKELSNIFEKLQDEADVPIEERYKMVKTYDSSYNDMVIMENIAKKGFRTYNRLDLVSLRFLELCVENIARFHGLSFVLKEKQPEYFKEKLKPMKYPVIIGDEFRNILKNISNSVLNHVDEDVKVKVMTLYKILDKKIMEYYNDETIKTCLCHGDYRPNNIMMKENDGEVQEVISIDYQVIYYGCPIFDLLYLIYLCTDRDFRKKYMSDLKNLYYDTLQKFLKYFNLDAAVVYPRDEFERVFKEKMDYGLFIALQFLPFIFACEEDIPDITNLANRAFPIDHMIKDRLQGVLEEFTELGFI